VLTLVSKDGEIDHLRGNVGQGESNWICHTNGRLECSSAVVREGKDSGYVKVYCLSERDEEGPEVRFFCCERQQSTKIKVKVVNLYSASSCTHTSNALFITNQSRQSHCRRVQPAACKHRLAHQPARQPSQLYKGPFHNPHNGLLLI